MNRFYRKTKGAIALKAAWEGDDIRALLVDVTKYSPDFNKDEYLDDIPSAAVIALSEPLTDRSFVLDEGFAGEARFGKVFKGQVGGLVVFRNAGDTKNSRLIVFSDEVEDFPFTANGAVVTIGWGDEGKAGKVFRI